jgi:hypothetical protein
LYYLFHPESVVIMAETQKIIASLLQQRTPVSFTALGPSMHPTIRNGESVFVRPLAAGTIPCGSVILYKIYGRITTHRCIFNEARTNRVFTVGDAAVKGGDWIPTGDILGVAESVRRNGHSHRLDTRLARWSGLARYALRPLRRALWHFRQTYHAPTPVP